MITLYKFGPAFGLPDPSPFVTKSDMLLKLAGLDYKASNKGFKKAPKGKLPYIDDDGEIVADSSFIRWHIEKKYGFDFDAGLSPEERGVAWAVEKLLEDNLYWIAIHWRWIDEKNYQLGTALFFKKIPWPMRPLIESAFRRKIRRNLSAQGTGRHSVEEQLRLAAKTFQSLAAILGDKPYLMGAKPSSVDAAFFAFMSSALCPHFDTPLRTEAEKYPNIKNYVERMQAAYYPKA